MSRRKLPLEVCVSLYKGRTVVETIIYHCDEVLFSINGVKLMDANHTLATINSNEIEWIRKTPKKGQL